MARTTLPRLPHLPKTEIRPRHWLLLDREARTCQVGTPEAVHTFLRTHNPPPALPPTPLEGLQQDPAIPLDEFLDRFLQAFHEVSMTFTHEDLQTRLAQQQQPLSALVAWLEAQHAPPH